MYIHIATYVVTLLYYFTGNKISDSSGLSTGAAVAITFAVTFIVSVTTTAIITFIVAYVCVKRTFEKLIILIIPMSQCHKRRCYMNKCVYPASLLLRMIWSYNLIQPMVQVVRLPWILILLMKVTSSLHILFDCEETVHKLLVASLKSCVFTCVLHSYS